MKPHCILITAVIIVLISGCLGGSSPKTSDSPGSNNALTNLLPHIDHNLTPTPNATTTANVTPTPIEYFDVRITSLPSEPPNLTLIVDIPKTEINNTNVTIYCNASGFTDTMPNITSDNYFSYVFNDVSCENSATAWIGFGRYNITAGIPSAGGAFEANVTRQR